MEVCINPDILYETVLVEEFNDENYMYVRQMLY